MPYQAKGDNMSSLLHKIHSIKTAQELLDLGSEIKGSSEYPNTSSSLYTKRYYHNHIGRELNKKIALFNLEDTFYSKTLGVGASDFYFPPSDGGLRPDLNQL